MRAAALLILAVLSGCDGRSERHAGGSVTVALPAPRPAASRPGFSFANAAETPRHGAERQ